MGEILHIRFYPMLILNSFLTANIKIRAKRRYKELKKLNKEGEIY